MFLVLEKQPINKLRIKLQLIRNSQYTNQSINNQFILMMYKIRLI